MIPIREQAPKFSGPDSKEPLRQEIAQHIAEFEQRGGKATVIPSTERTIKNPTYNQSMNTIFLNGVVASTNGNVKVAELAKYKNTSKQAIISWCNQRGISIRDMKVNEDVARLVLAEYNTKDRSKMAPRDARKFDQRKKSIINNFINSRKQS